MPAAKTGPNVAQAIAAVIADVNPVGKDSVNPQQHFRYRGIEALTNALNPILAKHGVVVVPRVQFFDNEERATARGGSQTMTTMLVNFEIYGPAGDSVTAATVGMALDTSDKSANKAMSAAFKYVLGQVFCVPFADLDDSDSVTIERAAPREQRQTNGDVAGQMIRLGALAETAGLTIETMTAKWRRDHNGMDMETFAGLPAPTLRRLADEIEAYQRTQEAAESPQTPAEGDSPSVAPNGATAPPSGLGEPGSAEAARV